MFGLGLVFAEYALTYLIGFDIDGFEIWLFSNDMCIMCDIPHLSLYLLKNTPFICHISVESKCQSIQIPDSFSH